MTLFQLPDPAYPVVAGPLTDSSRWTPA